MKEWIKAALKKKKWQFALAFALLGVIIALSGVLSASAGMFDDYEVNAGNDLIAYVEQKKYTGEDNKGAARYATKQWYLFTQEDYGEFGFDGANLDSWNETIFKKYGTAIDFKTIASTTPDEDAMYTQTRKADAETLVGAVLEKYNTEEKRGELFNEDGITVYFAPVIQCTYYKEDGVGIRKQGSVYSYADFEDFYPGYVTWSTGAERAVQKMYATSIVLNFSHIGFSIQVEDENGDLPEGYRYHYDDNSAKNQEGVPLGGKVLFGESISGVQYPGKITGYEYIGYEFRTGDGTVVKDGTGTTTGNYTVLKDKVGDSEELVLVFRYVTAEPTPAPFSSPTPKPEVSPTPIPTLGPTSTPAPTPQPSTNDNVVERYEYYFTTDMGYTMDEIAGSTSYYVSAYDGSKKGGNLNSSEYTKRPRSYRKGTDENGNTWYFLEDGTSAAYVHPAIYNGYDADTEEVRYITELVFPEVLTYYGKEYTVVSIGGGSAKYRAYDQGEDSSENASGSRMESETWNYDIINGSYLYDYGYYTDSLDRYRQTEVSYSYGVLGTGRITSYGYEETDYLSSGGTEIERYYRNYYVYNTTLSSITIPDTVTTILPDAFEYCQALVEVNGGKNVTDVQESSFAGASELETHLSYSFTEVEWDGSKSTDTYYYYYNESCKREFYYLWDGSIKYSASSTDTDIWYSDNEPDTPVMLAWKEKVQLPEYFRFPDFVKLDTLGSYSFARRSNLHYVELSDTVTVVDPYAFTQCLLDGIRIPSKNTKISYSNENYRFTLGTKGNVENKTIIYADLNSLAATYGLTFWQYYQLDFGYPVIYHSNTAPEKTYETHSQIKPVLKTVNAVLYYAKSTDQECQFVYIDASGKLWRYENETFTELIPGKTFSDILYDRSGSVSSVTVSGGRRYYYSILYAVSTEGEVYKLARKYQSTDRVYTLEVTQLIPGSSEYSSYQRNAAAVINYTMSIRTGITYSAKVYGNMFTPPEGYYFNGWNEKADGTGKDYAEDQTLTVSGEMHLYARWKKFDNIIRYHSNGGSGTMADTVVDAEIHTAKLTPNTFFRTGYKFVGWNTEADGSGTSYRDEDTVEYFTGTLNLYARWEEVITYYTVVYMTYPFGSTENEVWKSVKLAYNQTGTAEGAPYTPSGYTVSYDTNKKASMSTTPEPLVLTEKNTKTDAPEFDRWRLYKRNNSGTLTYQGRAFTEGQTLYRLSKTDGDILYLYPVWGGADSGVLLPSAECEGYSLVGWSESKDGSGTIYYVGEDVEDGGTYTPAKDTTLYAVWMPENSSDRQESQAKFIITDTDDLEALKLLKEGSQALTIKKGYSFSYRLILEESFYDEVEEVQIEESYYWVSEDGLEREEVNLYGGIVENILTESEPQSRKGKFFLSAKTLCIANNSRLKVDFETYLKMQTLSGREDFIKNEGFLVISFDIMIRNHSGAWYEFTEWEQTELAEDALAAGWKYVPGDVIRYDLSKSIADDYEVGGVE